jgi:signal transduction histidine kinase
MTSTPIDRPPADEAVTAGVGRVLTNVRAFAAAVRRAALGPNGPFAAALVLAGIALIEFSIYRDGPDNETAILLNLGATLPLGLAPRRLWLAAGLITLATVVALTQKDPAFTAAGIAGQLVVAYLVARHYPRWASAALALPFAINAVSPFTKHGPSAVLLVVLVVAAQVLGDVERRRGEAVAERDATRQAMTETLDDQALMAERGRIAHELHDIVAHHISMISVQAEAARLATPGIPDEGRQRLAAISETARSALDEMRRLLGVLASDDEAAERVPQPGLAQLDDLLDAARSAGTPVRLVLQGSSLPLPPSVDLAAYRIVQESLTNARRHAPGAAVTVEVRYGDMLHLRVWDDGSGPATEDARPPGRRGHGLVGMAERAALAGGSLEAGPGQGGGFVVEAALPLRGAPSTERGRG